MTAGTILLYLEGGDTNQADILTLLYKMFNILLKEYNNVLIMNILAHRKADFLFYNLQL